MHLDVILKQDECINMETNVDTEEGNSAPKLIWSAVSEVLNSLLQFPSPFDVTSICNLSPN